MISKYRQAFDKQYWSYLLRSAAGMLSRERLGCPACGSDSSTIIKRKMIVTALARCQACRLLFRIPTDPANFGQKFYQKAYRSDFTTDCPTADELQGFLNVGFARTPKDFSARIRILKSLGAQSGARILDYGASWGYGCWQLQQAGYEVEGFELSQPRARYARERLEQRVVTDLSEIDGTFDMLFTCHVLEHLTNPTAALHYARAMVRPGGLLVAFTPNGSFQYLQRDARAYHRHWGMVHPSYLDEEYYQTAFPDCPKLLCSNPYDHQALSSWNREDDNLLDLSGGELLFVTKL